MVDAPYDLLPLFREREHPAVALEQMDDVGEVSRNQGRRKLLDQRGQLGRNRAPERPGQGLLRGRQLVQERSVPEQRNERGFVTVEAFVGGVEECPVSQDGAAKGPPALAPSIRRVGRIEVVAGLEVPVAEHSEDGPAKLVGPSLGDDVDGSPGRSAQFRGKRIAVDLKLLHRVLTDGGADAAGGVVVVQSIDGEGVAAPTAAADTESGRGGRGDAVVAVIRHIVRVDDAGSQQRQVQVVAAVDGQILDAGRVDMVGLLGLVVGDGDPRRFRRDFNGLGGHGYLGGKGLGLSHQHLQALGHVGSEPGQLEAERVEPGIDPAQDVFADLRGEGLPGHAAALVSGGNGDAGENGPGLIVDVAANGAGVGLGGKQDRAGQQNRRRDPRSAQRAPQARMRGRRDQASDRHDGNLPHEIDEAISASRTNRAG